MAYERLPNPRKGRPLVRPMRIAPEPEKVDEEVSETPKKSKKAQDSQSSTEEKVVSNLH